MNTPNEFPAPEFELYDIKALVLEATITYNGYEDIKQNIGTQVDPDSEGAKILSDAENLIGRYRNTYDQFRDADAAHAQLCATEDKTFAEAAALKETLEQEKQRPEPISKPAAQTPYVQFRTQDGVESSSASQRVLSEAKSNVDNHIDETNADIADLEAQIRIIETEELPQLWQKLDEKQVLISNLLNKMTLISRQILDLALLSKALPQKVEDAVKADDRPEQLPEPSLPSRGIVVAVGQIAVRRGLISNTVISLVPIDTVDKDSAE